MSDDHWKSEVTWGAPPFDAEATGARSRTDTPAGPDWVIPPPTATGTTELGGWPPEDPGGGRRGPSRGTVTALVACIVVTLLLGSGAGLGLRADRDDPSTSRSTATAPLTPLPSVTTPDPGVAVAALNLTEIAAKLTPSVVDIASTLGYQNGAAAGTGMVLTASGEVLTNNHVIDGATRLTAEVNGGGDTYDIKVLGSDSTHDVALIQLVGASGLTPITVGDPSRVAVGDQVVALGNALGRTGPPAVEPGYVTGIEQSITAGDPSTGTSEELTGLIQVDAALKPGDSGGPLVDMTGSVIGLDTAASVASRYRPSANAGFAIPIDDALAVVAQIRSGVGSDTVQIGQPAFLGVQLQFEEPDGLGTTAGARITGLIPDGPAEAAGFDVGDLIVSIDGRAVDSQTSLTALLRAHRPGDRIDVGLVDAGGEERTARLRLGTGPAS